MGERRQTLASGTVLNEHYRIDEVIGFGGFAITYKGLNMEKNVVVAIKEFSPICDDMQMEHEKARFVREAQILREFDYLEGIVSVRDVFEQEKCVYLVMDYIEGITLKDYVREYGTFSYDELVRMVTPVMRSLTKIHRRNVTHCDISPDNLIIGMDNRLWLIDFGATQHTNIKSERTVIIKQGYAPIEQYYSNGSTYDGRIGSWTDVYAFASTMYMALTGKKPRTAVERMQGVVSSEAESDGNASLEVGRGHREADGDGAFPGMRRTYNAEAVAEASKRKDIEGAALYSILTGWQADALLKAMAVDKSERYATMDDFLEAISYAPDSADDVTRILQTGLLKKRRKRFAYVFGLLLIAIFSMLLGFGISWFMQDNGKTMDRNSVVNNPGQTGTDNSVVNNLGQTGTDNSVADSIGQTDTDNSIVNNPGQMGTDNSVVNNPGQMGTDNSVVNNLGQTDTDNSVANNSVQTDTDNYNSSDTQKSYGTDKETDGQGAQQGKVKTVEEKTTQAITEAPDDDDDLY